MNNENNNSTVSYKEISDCIRKLQNSISADEIFKKETPLVKGSDCTVVALNASDGDGMSHFRVDINEGSVDVSSGGGGYILTSIGKNGEAMKEETEYAIAKAIKDATGKECYPRSGCEPWSWKGILNKHTAL